jgi:hypothetical protein
VSQTPVAGWYDDPLGDAGERFWDGQSWTETTRPWPAPTTVAPPDPAPSVPSGAVPRRRAPLVLATAALVVVLGAVTVYAAVGSSSRGSGSPTEAAEALVAAVTTDSWGTAIGLLAPDEVRWIAAGLEGWGSELRDAVRREGLPASIAEQFDIEVSFGPVRALVTGVEYVPVDRIDVVAGEGDLAEAMRDEVGGSQTIDLRDQRFGLVAVERDGGWFISPIGTALEAVSQDRGFPGAGAARERSGAADGPAAVEGAVDALSRSFTGVLDLIDPTELRILDHYDELLWALDGPADVGSSVSVDLTPEGTTTFRIDRVHYRDDWGEVTTDMIDFCVSDDRETTCLADELPAMRRDVEMYEDDPWVAFPFAVTEAFVSPQPHPIRIETVQRDGRSFVSLAGTSRATVAPLLDRVDARLAIDPIVREFARTSGFLDDDVVRYDLDDTNAD